MFIRSYIVILFSFFLMSFANADPSVFYDTNGKAMSLENLKGKWVVVNYWADWCSVCVKEIPELNHFNQDIKDKNIVFFSVDYDELSLNDLKASAASVGIQYPVLTTDPGYVWNLDNIDVIPTTFIINPEGRVVKMITGPNTERSLLNTINALQDTLASNK